MWFSHVSKLRPAGGGSRFVEGIGSLRCAATQAVECLFEWVGGVIAKSQWRIYDVEFVGTLWIMID